MLHFLIAALILFIYAYKQRNNPDKFITYPTIMGVLTLVFAYLSNNHYLVAQIIVTIIIWFLIIWSIVADRRRIKNRK